MIEFALQHRTTRAYLTADNNMAPALAEAVTFESIESAELILQGLEDFARAWDVVVVVGRDWPAEFPGAWQHWPADIRAAACEMLTDHWLRQFGAADLVKHIVSDLDRRDPSTGRELPFTARAEKFWPLFMHHARLHVGARALKQLRQPQGVTDGPIERKDENVG